MNIQWFRYKLKLLQCYNVTCYKRQTYICIENVMHYIQTILFMPSFIYDASLTFHFYKSEISLPQHLLCKISILHPTHRIALSMSKVCFVDWSLGSSRYLMGQTAQELKGAKDGVKRPPRASNKKSGPGGPPDFL